MKPIEVGKAVEKSTRHVKVSRSKSDYDKARKVKASMDSARPVQTTGQENFDDKIRALRALHEPPERVEDVRQRYASEIEVARTRMEKCVAEAQLNTKKALREEIRNAEEEMERRVLAAQLSTKKALREEMRNAKDEMRKSVLEAKKNMAEAKNKIRRALVTRDGTYEVGEEIGRG